MPSSTWNLPWLMRSGSDRHAGLVHRRPVAVDAGAAAQDPLRPADHADPPVSERQQMPRRSQAAVPVGRPDRWRVVERLPGRVDDDVRDAAGRELLPHRLAEIGEDRDHAGRTAGQHALHPASTGRSPALHLAQDDREVMLPGDALHAPDDLERPLALELVEDHLEERRPRTRPGRPPIAVLADGGFDAAARVGRHVRPPVDHLGHRRHRHTGQLGDIGDRGGRGMTRDGSDWAWPRGQCSERSRATKVSMQRSRPAHHRRNRFWPVKTAH